MERLPVEMAEIPAISVLRRSQPPTSTIRRDNPEKPVRIRGSGSRANPPQDFLGDRESEEGRRPREEENRTGYTYMATQTPRENRFELVNSSPEQREREEPDEPASPKNHRVIGAHHSD